MTEEDGGARAPGARADALVREWALDLYRDRPSKAQAVDDHLAACSDTVIEAIDAGDSFYGCETGCSFLRVTLTLSCPHGARQEDWEGGELGMELADVLEDLEARDQ